MFSRDLIGGTAAAIIGAAYLLLAGQVRSSALDDAMGPGGMPQAYGWSMLVLGLVLITIAVSRQWHRAHSDSALAADKPATEANTEQQVSKADAPSIGRQIARAGGLLLFGVAYVLLIETLGYLLSIALLIVAVALYMGAHASFRLLLIGALGALAMWVMFVQLLGVAMPAGVLDFL